MHLLKDMHHNMKYSIRYSKQNMQIGRHYFFCGDGGGTVVVHVTHPYRVHGLLVT